MRLGVAVVVVNVLIACRAAPTSSTVATSSSPSSSLSPSPSTTTTRSADLVAARPYRLDVPPRTVIDAGGMPLVVLIHGYGSSGAEHDAYFGMSKATNARGVLLAIPDGTRDHKGKLFWNATEACCDFDNLPVDDVAYIDAIIDDASLKEHVDPDRIYIIGHSNGAFLAHRYACERSDRIAAIVALAGVPWSDASKCQGKDVSVLQIHGDADPIIAYGGGKSFGNGAPYPSAEATVAAWALRDECGTTRRALGDAVDLDKDVPEAETTREAYDCPTGIDVALWRMKGAGHVPRFGPRFAAAALDFLLAHKRAAR